MRALILGVGLVGGELGKHWRAQGHHIVGTTTTPDKLEALRSVCHEVAVVRADERERIGELARGADVVVVTVSPRIARAVTREQRAAHYAEVLVRGAESAVAACPRVVFCSSYSVFGDGLGASVLDESSPVTSDDEPSAVAYQAAERVVLGAPSGTVLRLPDIYGAPGDMSFKERLELAHRLMGSRVPFSGEGRLHRIHVRDVVRALDFVTTRELSGLFHVCDDEVLPPTNREAFDALADAHGLPKLDFRGELKTPTGALSMAKLRAQGFTLAHVDRTIA